MPTVAPLKVGDVVTLRSRPDLPMTVTRLMDSTGQVECTWLDTLGGPRRTALPKDAVTITVVRGV